MEDRPDLAPALAAFPRERTWLLPALHAVQHVLGYLPGWALAETAAHLRVPASEVFGVASGYPEFRLAARGRHHARVCTGVSCALVGGRDLLAEIARGHAVRPGQLGADRPLTLEEADCFFACPMAPLIEVDEVCHGRVTAADLPRLLPPPAARSARRSAAREAEGSAGRGGEPGQAPAAAASPPAGARAGRAEGEPGSSAAQYLARLVASPPGGPRAEQALRLAVQAGTCGRAVGAGALLGALASAVEAQGLGHAARVIEGACAGACYAAPSVEVHHPLWPRALVERVSPASAGALVAALARSGVSLAEAGFAGVTFGPAPWRGLPPAGLHPFWSSQERVLLARCGAVDPERLDEALAAGAYAALARALDGPPGAAIAAVKAAGLQGRGGAFFPTAAKWEACRAARGAPKYLVVNGEEGEPGIFKDRHLMEGDPHQLLEGALLAAHAAGAERVILYIHGEAHLSARRMAGAVEQARAAGIVGDRVLGTGWACHVQVRRGAGGFVLGEETALLESIEGRRAQPRTRPPFPVESGLWGRPTVVNNVETLSAIPAIVARGGEWFAALGTPRAPGTKLFGLSGPLVRGGVVEMRNGVSLADLLAGAGGGLRDGGRFLGAVVGGPSGQIVPAALFDVPMEPRGAVSPGTGGVVAVPEGVSAADVVRTLLRFNAAESCGKCTPCREGTPRLLAMVDGLRSADGRAARLEEARGLAEAIQLASLCGLGQAAPLALLHALESHPAHFFDG